MLTVLYTYANKCLRNIWIGERWRQTMLIILFFKYFSNGKPLQKKSCMLSSGQLTDCHTDKLHLCSYTDAHFFMLNEAALSLCLFRCIFCHTSPPTASVGYLLLVSQPWTSCWPVKARYCPITFTTVHSPEGSSYEERVQQLSLWVRSERHPNAIQQRVRVVLFSSAWHMCPPVMYSRTSI